MSKPLKYFLLVVGALGIMSVVAVVTLSVLVDVQSYKPRIEQLVSDKMGYPVRLEGDLSLSIFPWLGLSFTDLRLDNRQGFSTKTFITIESFQARLKLLPLLSRHVEVSSFVVKRPEIFLEKNTKGVWNWENLVASKKPPAAGTAKEVPAVVSAGANQPPAEDTPFILQSLMVGEFSIANGRVQINDAATTERHELTDFTLQLADVSLNKPINLTMAAVFDGKPLKIAGAVGPLGSNPGAGKINLDLSIQALDLLDIQLGGSVDDIARQKRYHLVFTLQPFSPKKLFTTLDRPFPVSNADPQVLQNLGLKGTVIGDTGQLAVSEGTLLFDDSTISFNLTAKDFSRPNLAVTMAVDSLDLDRYLPAEKSAADKAAAAPGQPQTPQQAPNAVPAPSGQPVQDSGRDYAPLRTLVLQAGVKLATMQVHGGTLSELAMSLTGQNGIYTINSLAMELYGGKIDGTGTVNVQQAMPATEINLSLQDVQIGPLLHDFAEKDIIEGKLKAQVALSMRGDTAASVKKTLNGRGDLRFTDGALLGIDLAQMARTIKTGFALEQQGVKPKTDFAELHVPFTITNGLVNTPETTLRSPFIRMRLAGDADLANETLDMKVQPTIVGTSKGQGDEEQRAGLSVPILVSGTFKAPKFAPDLESLAKDQMLTKEELGEIIKTGKIPEERKEKFKEDVEQAKELLKGLFGK